MTLGSDLLNRLNEGEFDTPEPEFIDKVRTDVSAALAELIEWGFRARPLMCGDEFKGMIRGVHPQERRQVFLWHKDPFRRISFILSLGTTLSKEEIADLDGYEATMLLRVIDRMTMADLSLYPYIYAFSTTTTSETLWHAQHANVSSWTNRTVVLPDGVTFRLLTASDHARLWSGVAYSREVARKKLEDTFNAAMIVKALTGRGGDRLYAALAKHQNAFRPDLADPWTKIVQVAPKNINFTDGWGHSHQDDSVEGIMREVEGMFNMDKHEKFMEAFYAQQMDQAHDQESALSSLIEEEGLVDSIAYLSPEQAKGVGQEARDQQDYLTSLARDAMGSIQDSEERRSQR